MRALLIVIFVAAGLGSNQSFAQSCEREPSCKAMRSCTEADFYFRQCGHAKRDGDGDGIPCEDVCGKTMKQYSERLAVEAGR